jgi:hypothetical protein
MFSPVQLESHRRLGSWGYRWASDAPEDSRPRGFCGLTEGKTCCWMIDAQCSRNARHELIERAHTLSDKKLYTRDDDRG